jgi:magnesium transporter
MVRNSAPASFKNASRFAKTTFAKVSPVQTNPEDYIEYHYDDVGSAPGTLTIDADALPSELVLIEYSAEQAIKQTLALEPWQPELIKAMLENDAVTWLDVRGLGSESVLRNVGEAFSLHRLVLEDVVNVPQRPKIEQYEDQLVIISRMVTPHSNGQGFFNEQVAFVLGPHYLLTVQEEPELDCFESVRDRIRHRRGQIRELGPDYLAYALLDSIIDGFFPVLEDFGERIEALEEEVIRNPTRPSVEKIYRLRRDLMVLRRAIWPQREMLNQLIRDRSPLLSEDVLPHLQDCYDHVVQVLDILESYRELAISLMDMYLSSVSNRMNEVMKVLTIISTIFIPLSFVAGVYGMNFDTQVSPWNMPELSWPWGYPLCLLGMGCIAGGLIVFFWRKGWFKEVS